MNYADDPVTPSSAATCARAPRSCTNTPRRARRAKLTYEECAEKVCLQNPGKEADNVRKRAVKYRDRGMEDFAGDEWLFDFFPSDRRDGSAAAKLSEEDKLNLDSAALFWARWYFQVCLPLCHLLLSRPYHYRFYKAEQSDSTALIVLSRSS